MQAVKTVTKAANKPTKPTFYDRVVTLAEMVLQHPKNEQERQEAARVQKMMQRAAKNHPA